MKFKTSIIGIILFMISLSVGAKTLQEFFTEAKAKSPICQDVEKKKR